MKITTTTSAEINLTLVLPDTYLGQSDEAIQEALLEGEGTILAIEFPDAGEVYSCASTDIQEGNFSQDDAPLTAEESKALAGDYSLTHYYS